MLNHILSRCHFILPLLVLLAAAFGIYAGSFDHAWTYDDFPVVVENLDIRSLSAFINDSYAGRPLRELTYLFDYSLFGLEPSGYHIQNIFWHGLNGFLILLLASRLGASALAAWGSALLFIAHPVLVEVVANISHRKDSLVLACALAAILAYREVFRSVQRPWQFAWMAIALLLGFTAYAAKQNALALLPLAFAYEWAFVPRQQRFLSRYRLVCPLLLMSGLIYGAYWYIDGGRAVYLFSTQFVFSKMSYYGPFNEWVYGLMLLKSWAFMFVKVLFPVDLAVEYSYTVPNTLFDPWVLSGLVVLLSYAVGLWLSWRRNRTVFFWLVWIGAFWVPASNIWPQVYFAADRYLYAPMAGMAVLSCYLLDLVPRRLSALRWSALAVCVLILALLTWRQDQTWRDELSLWSHAVKVSPDSVYALNNLGAEYGNMGQIAKALELVGRAAQNPFYKGAQLNMARIYEHLGQRERAAFYYQRAGNPHAAPVN